MSKEKLVKYTKASSQYIVNILSQLEDLNLSMGIDNGIESGPIPASRSINALMASGCAEKNDIL